MELSAGQVVKAQVEEGDYNGTPQLTVSRMKVVDTPPDDFMPRTKRGVEEMYAELRDFAGGIADDSLARLADRVTADERWKRWPAAKGMHHAFIGGLLEHTVGLCRLADRVASLYPALRRDLLVIAAICHDYGKVQELSVGSSFDYTDEGELVGHIALGLLAVDRLMDDLGFGDELRTTVRHLILCHHGRLEWGSPKVPMIIEGLVFHKLDEIDASVAALAVATERSQPDAKWVEIKFREKFFLGERPKP